MLGGWLTKQVRSRRISTLKGILIGVMILTSLLQALTSL